jgi:uncharacterized protein (DUF2132 family)/uncharacterized protein YjbJ (UPF0337 family)
MPDSNSKDPLHGMTLEAILNALVAEYGWEGLARRVNINCFKNDPSVKSSLTFLRKTPWARTEVEDLYVTSRLRIRDRAGAAGAARTPSGVRIPTVGRARGQEGADNVSEHAGEDLKGRVKEAVGDVTGDTGLKVEGKLDRASAATKKTFDNAADKLREIVNPKESDQQ